MSLGPYCLRVIGTTMKKRKCNGCSNPATVSCDGHASTRLYICSEHTLACVCGSKGSYCEACKCMDCGETMLKFACAKCKTYFGKEADEKLVRLKPQDDYRFCRACVVECTCNSGEEHYINPTQWVSTRCPVSTDGKTPCGALMCGRVVAPFVRMETVCEKCAPSLWAELDRVAESEPRYKKAKVSDE